MKTVTTQNNLTLLIHTKSSIDRYVEYGVCPGDFLLSVLRNDLKGAIDYGDEDSIRHLRDTVRYLFNNCPGLCWGTDDKVDQWMREKKR